jgi:hypothetical protein
MAALMIPPAEASAFLAAHGWGGADIRSLAGDASFRRYFRVTGPDGATAVLMDAPPPHEDPRPFAAIARWLCDLGLCAPRILAVNFDRGLLLIEDFGDDRLREALDAAPERERVLYEVATDLLVHLHRHPPMPGLPRQGLSQWLDELSLFVDWYCPALGLEVDRDSYVQAWTETLAPIEGDGLGPVTVLRDYHA